MDLEILKFENQKVARSISNEVVVNDTQDALDLMADADYQGARSIILAEANLSRDFFDL